MYIRPSGDVVFHSKPAQDYVAGLIGGERAGGQPEVQTGVMIKLEASVMAAIMGQRGDPDRTMQQTPPAKRARLLAKSF